MLDYIEPFTIAILFRTDLTRTGLTFEQIEAMSDLDMVNIANKMGRRYVQGSFLSDLEQAVNEVLSEKEEPHLDLDPLLWSERTWKLIVRVNTGYGTLPFLFTLFS